MVRVTTLALLLALSFAISSVGASRHGHRILARRFGTKPDCPEEAGKRNLQSYIANQEASLDAALSQINGGTREQSSTFVSDNGVPENVKVQETLTRDGSGGTSRHWSWSTSWHTSGKTPNGSPSKDFQPELAASFAPPRHAPAHVVTTKSHSTSTEYTHIRQGNQTYDSSRVTSTDSYSMVVNDYVITSHMSKSANAAPFSAAQVQWLKEHSVFNTLSVPENVHIPRPADSRVCNQRFPFRTETYDSGRSDSRFASAFPAQQLDPMAKRALELHNAERARYHLQPLQWNTELANMAACWADLKAYGHSEDHFCATGENIAYGYGSPCYTNPLQGMENAINSFLDEDRTYAAKRTFGEDTGHWTQIVWKDTRYVGCATSQRKNFLDEQNTSIYVVCEYYPAGNVMGQFELQVPTPQPTSQYRSQCSANEQHWS